MYFTHKFMDEEAHLDVVRSNTADMMTDYVVRHVCDAYRIMGRPYTGSQSARVAERIRVWVIENHATADMNDMADFISLVADEEIK